jgi:hypothetical protein
MRNCWQVRRKPAVCLITVTIFSQPPQDGCMYVSTVAGEPKRSILHTQMGLLAGRANEWKLRRGKPVEVFPPSASFQLARVYVSRRFPGPNWAQGLGVRPSAAIVSWAMVDSTLRPTAICLARQLLGWDPA